MAGQKFCSACGQSTRKHRKSLLGVCQDALGDFLAFDSKVFRSILPLLFKPGFLTAEYLAGKRASYISPVRLYVFVTIVFFWLSESVFEQFQIQISEEGAVEGRLSSHQLAQLLDALIESLPNFLVLGVPLIALLLYAIHRNPRHLFYDHLIFCLHNHAFFFILVFLVDWLPESVEGVVAPLVFFTYLLVALRRVYRRPWIRSAIKALILSLFYPLVLLGVLIGSALKAASASGVDLP